jgi:hypothetical protein
MGNNSFIQNRRAMKQQDKTEKRGHSTLTDSRENGSAPKRHPHAKQQSQRLGRRVVTGTVSRGMVSRSTVAHSTVPNQSATKPSSVAVPTSLRPAPVSRRAALSTKQMRSHRKAHWNWSASYLLTGFSLAVSALVVLMSALDLAFGWPLYRASILYDVVFLAGGAIMFALSYSVYKDLPKIDRAGVTYTHFARDRFSPTHR